MRGRLPNSDSLNGFVFLDVFFLLLFSGLEPHAARDPRLHSRCCAHAYSLESIVCHILVSNSAAAAVRRAPEALEILGSATAKCPVAGCPGLSERGLLTKALPQRIQVARETAFVRSNYGFCVSNTRGRLSEYSLNACVCLTVSLVVRHTRAICLNVVGMSDCAQAEHCLIRGQTQTEATTQTFSITACFHTLEQTRCATNILGACHKTTPATQMLRKNERHHRRRRRHLSRRSRTLPPRVAGSAAASAFGTADKKTPHTPLPRPAARRM